MVWARYLEVRGTYNWLHDPSYNPLISSLARSVEKSPNKKTGSQVILGFSLQLRASHKYAGPPSTPWLSAWSLWVSHPQNYGCHRFFRNSLFIVYDNLTIKNY